MHGFIISYILWDCIGNSVLSNSESCSWTKDANELERPYNRKTLISSLITSKHFGKSLQESLCCDPILCGGRDPHPFLRANLEFHQSILTIRFQDCPQFFQLHRFADVIIHPSSKTFISIVCESKESY